MRSISESDELYGRGLRDRTSRMPDTGQLSRLELQAKMTPCSLVTEEETAEVKTDQNWI
jgi:hypothetical protein